MPPWSQMTPQQQAMLLQMMQAQFGGGRPGMTPGATQQPTMAQQMMQPGQMQGGINPMQAQMANPLLNPQQNNLMQNPQMLQYLLAMRGAQAPGMGQFSAPQAPQYTQYPGF